MNRIIPFLSLILCLHVYAAEPAAEGAVLEATLTVLPQSPSSQTDHNIQPGTPVSIGAQLRNVGTKPSAAGSFYVRFIYPEPISKQLSTPLFTTEKVHLPTIAPGSSASLMFNTPQTTPSLFDFIRQDWNLRQYEAVAVIDNKEYILGNTRLTFSAYYYPGAPQELPVQVPAH